MYRYIYIYIYIYMWLKHLQRAPSSHAAGSRCRSGMVEPTTGTGRWSQSRSQYSELHRLKASTSSPDGKAGGNGSTISIASSWATGGGPTTTLRQIADFGHPADPVRLRGHWRDPVRLRRHWRCAVRLRRHRQIAADPVRLRRFRFRRHWR